jgi:ankyrin repeat protein
MKKNNVYLTLIIVLVTVVLTTACSAAPGNPNMRLSYAVQGGNLELVKESLADGANINQISSIPLKENNPVRLAMSMQQEDIAEYLAEHGADANYTDSYGTTQLMYYASNTRIPMCELLLKQGAKVDQTDKDGLTALDYALRAGVKFSTDQEVNRLLNLLFEHGAKVNSNSLQSALNGYEKYTYCRYGTVKRILEETLKAGIPSGLDPVLEAAMQGKSADVDRLIQSRQMKKEDEQKVLFFTAAFGNVDTIKLLKTNGLDLQAKDARGNNALIIASTYGQLEIVRYLLDQGLDLEGQNYTEDTALIAAAIHDQNTVAEYLIKRGAVMHYEPGKINDVFVIAGQNGNIGMMKIIIANGYAADDERLGLALLCAAQKNQVKSIEFLIQNHADPNYNYQSEDPLYSASALGNLEAVKTLVENGASVDKEMNPLEVSSEYGHKDIVAYLLQKGANVNKFHVIKDGDTAGKTSGSALMAAVSKGYLDIVKLLIENGADLEYKAGNADDQTALTLAAKSGSRNIMEYLLDKGTKINYQDANGETALMIASKNGFAECVNVLLNHKPDMSLKNKQGQTALDLAKSKGDKNNEAIKALENANKNM